LRPVRIGRHGETLRRLLVPGFHSGTIPKLFAKRRRAAHQAAAGRHVDRQMRFIEKLNHEAEALRHLVERELIGLLHESRTYRGRAFSVGRVDLATNRVSVTLCDARQVDEPVVIQFCEQSGWIVGNVAEQGWLREMVEEDRKVFRSALAGLYKRGAVGLVREQIESRLVGAPVPVAELSAVEHAIAEHISRNTERESDQNAGQADGPATHPYDVSAEGLVVWPNWHFDTAIKYSLTDRPTTSPRPRSLARASGLAPLPLSALVYQEHPLAWEDWRAYWDTEQNVSAIPIRLLPDVDLLDPS
jgi:hypothetical protein